jgi:hypothetical protein
MSNVDTTPGEFPKDTGPRVYPIYTDQSVRALPAGAGVIQVTPELIARLQEERIDTTATEGTFGMWVLYEDFKTLVQRTGAQLLEVRNEQDLQP